MYQKLLLNDVNTERILLLDHHGLGEFLMSLPACRWLTAERGRSVWITISGVEKQICKNQRCGEQFIPFSIPRKASLKTIRFLWRLRRLHIDTVVALHGFEQTTVRIFTRLIGAKRFICFPAVETEMLDRNTLHKRHRHLNVISKFLGQPIPAGQESDYLLDDVQTAPSGPLSAIDRYIVLVPGSGEMERFKRWPLAHFASFANLFLKRYPDIKIVITGTEAEAQLARGIQNKVANSCIIDMCGKLSLKQLVGVFHRSIFVLGADCGGLHLANASGARVVVIMGPTNSALTGPIEADLIIDQQLAGTPWYCRRELKKRAYWPEDPSMDIPANEVLRAIEQRGFLDM